MITLPLAYAGWGDDGWGECGWGEDCPEEEEEIGDDVSGAGAIAAKTAIMDAGLCNESGFIWYKDMCYECDGEIIEKDGEILCLKCPDGFFLKDGKCESTVTDKIPIPSILLYSMIILIIVVILFKKSRKKQIKRLKKKIPKKEVEEIEKKIKESK